GPGFHLGSPVEASHRARKRSRRGRENPDLGWHFSIRVTLLDQRRLDLGDSSLAAASLRTPKHPWSAVACYRLVLAKLASPWSWTFRTHESSRAVKQGRRPGSPAVPHLRCSFLNLNSCPGLTRPSQNSFNNLA